MSILNIDKTDWKIVSLGDLATEVSERVENPSKSRYERFVGLGNFVSGDIKIKSWESTSSLASSAKAFKAGDILFARRNAYLRRASVVDFEGCCSGDAFVLRENLDKVVPGFLPFVMNSTGLWNYANANAAGTMSKRVKWRDLAKYEFLLPPKDQQTELAMLLWESNNMIERVSKVISEITFQSKVYLTKSFRIGAFLNQKSKESVYGDIPNTWKVKRLSTIGDFKNGVNKEKSDFGFGKPFVNLLDIFGFNDLYQKDFDLVNVSDKELDQYNIKKGDVLFVRSSVKPSGVGLTTLIQEDLIDTVYSGFIIRFRPKSDDLSHTFKKYCFYEERFRYSLTRRSTISANTNINQESLKKLFIPVPPPNEQAEFNRVMENFEELQKLSESKLESSKSLQISLINQIF